MIDDALNLGLLVDLFFGCAALISTEVERCTFLLLIMRSEHFGHNLPIRHFVSSAFYLNLTENSWNRYITPNFCAIVKRRTFH